MPDQRRTLLWWCCLALLQPLRLQAIMRGMPAPHRHGLMIVMGSCAAAGCGRTAELRNPPRSPGWPLGGITGRPSLFLHDCVI